MGNRVIDVDVAVIGAGPTGLVATALLGRRHKVALIERQPARYSLPRAGHLDHEIVRVLQGLGGAHQAILDDQAPCKYYTWVNADREQLFQFVYGAPSVSGFQSDYMMYQPILEDGVYRAIEEAPGRPVVEMGWEMIDIAQDARGVTVTARRRQGDDAPGKGGPEEAVIRAKYVLAADGAKSPTRRLLGIEQDDYGFSERWLDIDVRIKRPLPDELRELDAFQVCDPKRPTLLAPLGKRHFRWEWMLFDDERIEDFEAPERGLELLGEWNVSSDHVEILRQLVYTFEAKIAKSWRQGRVFLLGDAAHTMPPHMGQGLCSGVRDAVNLAWKLDLVLAGTADDHVLDSYEDERRPHSDAWIRISKAAGEISCITDPEKARERDEVLQRGEFPPLPPFPHLEAGVLHGYSAEDGDVGRLFPQAVVERDGETGLFHDVVGQGFHLVSGAGDLEGVLGDAEHLLLETLGVQTSVVDGAGGSGFVDVGGAYREYFGDKAVVLVRPDYYVYGTATRLSEVPTLLAALAADLHLVAGAEIR